VNVVNELQKPHVVVAAIIERFGRFLLVEEYTPEGVRLNQPAGHLEAGESLVEAVCRETLEETARVFTPEALTGVYRLAGTPSRPSFIRFAFRGAVGERVAGRPLDRDILRADWFSLEEIRANRARHRSPLVLRCIDDYLSGRHFPIDLLRDCDP